MLPTIFIVVVLAAVIRDSDAQAAITPYKCIQDSALSPIFGFTPGNYRPSTITVSACTVECSKLQQDFAGLQEGKYCLCSNDKAGIDFAIAKTCTLNCVDGNKCGGAEKGLTSVYRATGSVLPTITRPISVAVNGTNADALAVSGFPVGSTTFSMLEGTLAPTSGLRYFLQLNDGMPPRYLDSNGSCIAQIFASTVSRRITAYSNWPGQGSYTPDIVRKSIQASEPQLSTLIRNITCNTLVVVDANSSATCRISVTPPIAGNVAMIGYTISWSNYPIGSWAPWLGRNLTPTDTGFAQSATADPQKTLPIGGRIERTYAGWNSLDVRLHTSYQYQQQASFTLAASRSPPGTYVALEILIDKTNSTALTLTVTPYNRTCPGGMQNLIGTRACTASTYNATNQQCTGTPIDASAGYCKAILDASSTALPGTGGTALSFTIPASETGKMVKSFGFTSPVTAEAFTISVGTGLAVGYRTARAGEEADYPVLSGPANAVYVARLVSQILEQPYDVKIPCKPGVYQGVTASFNGILMGATNTTAPYSQTFSWDCQVPISGQVKVTLDKPVVRVNELITYTITVDAGAPITISIMGTIAGQNVTKWIKDATQTVTGTFSYSQAVDFSYVTASAYNLLSTPSTQLLSTLGNENGFEVQWPVDLNHWLFSIPTSSLGIYLDPDFVAFDFVYIGPAGQQASNVTATFDYGDGTPAEVQIKPAFPMVVQHKYAKSGTYDVTVTLENKVSSVVFPLKMNNIQTKLTIWTPIRGVAADFMYNPSGDGSSYIRGLGAFEIDFPQGQNISVFPRVESGVVEYYTIMHTNNTVIANVTPPDANNPSLNVPPATLYLPKDGLYNITLKACNRKEGCTLRNDTHYPVTISGRISGLQIDDYGIIIPPMAEKEFLLKFASLGGSPCILVDWGDSTMFEAFGENSTCKIAPDSSYAVYRHNVTLSNPLRVTHVYATEGVRNMSVLAWNAQSNVNAYIVVVSLNVSCLSPTASIVDGFAVKEFKRSLQAIFDGSYTLNCSSSVDARVEWGITHVNETNDAEISPIAIKDVVPSWNKTQLVLPALFLKYGYYKLRFTVFLAGNPIYERFPIQTSTYAYFRIIKSPLVCIVFDGGLSKILKGGQDFALLKPGFLSYDPDDRDYSLSPERPQYEYFCSRPGTDPNDGLNSTTAVDVPKPGYKKPTVDGGGCFGTGPARLNLTSLDFSVDTRIFFTTNTTYRISVNMSRDTRFSISFLDIEILPGNSLPMEVGIVCSPASACTPPMAQGILVNLDNGRFLAKGSCIRGCDEFSVLAYSWNVTIDRGSTLREAISPSQTDMVPFGFNNQDMMLAAPFFSYLYTASPDWKFIVRLVLRDNQTGVTGFSEIYLKINKAPTGGTCKCEANSFPFIALKTTLQCSCDGWYDPDGIGLRSYQFKSRRLDITDRVEEVIMDPIMKPEVAMAPVPGNHSITCSITDLTGAIITVAVPVTFTPNNFRSSFFAISAPTSIQLQEMEADGSIAAIVNANPALSEMVANIKLAVLQESLLTVTLIPGSETGGGLATSGGSGTANATSASASDVISAMSNTLTNVATSIASSNNMATPAQMTSAANSISSLISAVPAGSPAAAAAFSASFVDAAGDVFLKIGDSLTANPGAMSKSALASLSSSALKTALVVAPLSGTTGGCDVQPPNPDMSLCPEAERKRVVFDPPFPPPVGAVLPKDPEIEKCCIVLQEKGRALTRSSTGIMGTATKALAAIAETMPIGEVFVNQPAPGTTMQVTKKSASDIAGGTVAVAGASVGMPANFAIPGVTAGQAVGMSTVVMDKNPIAGESTQADRLTADSTILSFDLTGPGGKPLKVENRVDPIAIAMARSYTPKMALDAEESLTCINASHSTNSSTIESVVYSTIPPSAASDYALVEIRMADYSEPPEGMYVMLGRNLKPSLIKSYYSPKLLGRVAEWPLVDEYYTFLAVWENKSETGPIHAGVFELKDGLKAEDVAGKSNWDNINSFFKQNFSKPYCIRVSDGGLSYFDGKSWVSDGLKVTGITKTGISFETTHLSTFGSGFFVKPNAIDFSSVFAKAGFNDNMTIYLTLIFTFAIYLLLMIWARIKDKKDIQMVGALPLPDNKPGDKYIYEILVNTGNQNSAATQSKVSLVVSGDQDQTGVRTFGKPNQSPRPFFVRGETDAFVMAVPRPLGDIQFLRLWHDCSGIGPMCSWFCSSVSIRDVQTGKTFDFVVNRWLSPTDDDGEVDRLAAVANDEDRKQFKYLFDTQSSKNLRDGHLWFSVFTRPPRSRFTRAQRVSTCMALLYLSMLANAMWYGTIPEQPGTGSLKFGPFALSQEQIGVGLMANLVVLPPSILIVLFFRKARPRRLRQSRIDQALLQQRQVTDAKGKGILPRTRRFTLPWWFRIVAWVLCLACIGVSVFFLWAYGVTFGNDKCTKWISSLMISFFSSILLVQPLKVMVIAMIMSAICKVGPEDDDADEDEDDPTLQWDESYLIENPHEFNVKRSQRMEAAKDLPGLAAIREKRRKEIQMWVTIKEFMFYSLYIAILIVVSYNNRDPSAGLLRNTMEKMFIKPRYLNESDRFSGVSDVGPYWKWVERTLVTQLRANEWYNGLRPFGLQGFLNDYNNRLIGYAIMRQVRVQPDSCVVHKKMREGNITRCSGLSGVVDEDREDYCTSWRKPGPTVADADCQWPEFKYTSQGKFDSLPHVGRMDTYTGGGYAFLFQGRQREITQRLDLLKRSEWLDTYTRAIFVEFATYNAQVNLFTIAKIVVEAIPGGGLVPAWRFDGVRLMRYFEGFGMVALICEVSFVAFTLYFTVVAIRAWCKQGKEFFQNYWSYLEICQLIFSYIAIILYLIRMVLTDNITAKFEETFGNAYIAMQYVGFIDEQFGYMIAFLLFAAMLSLLKILRYNRNIALLASTMKLCFDELLGFGVVFCIFLAAFVLMFHVFLNQHLSDWKTVSSSFETSFAIMLGKFEFGSILETNLLAGIAFFFFNVAISIIMINVLMTIIIRSFETAKGAADKLTREHEVIEFMILRCRQFLGFGMSREGIKTGQIQPGQVMTNPRNSQSTYLDEEGDNKGVRELPEKMDKMMAQINDMYFGGSLDFNNKEWLKAIAGKKKKNRKPTSMDLNYE